MRAPTRPKVARSPCGLPERRGRCCSAWRLRWARTAGDGDALVRALMAGHWDEAGLAIDQAAASAGAHAQDWADLLQRLAHGLERGSRLWTAARKKDSLTRVLSGSRSDAQRLRERVRHLLAAWEAETDEPVSTACTAGCDDSAAGATAPGQAGGCGAGRAAPCRAWRHPGA